MERKTRSQVLLIAAYCFVVAAASTLIPASSRIQNDLGYYSVCTFTPWSTLLLLLVAGVLAAFRTYMISRTD